MTIRFLQTTPSGNPDAPFMAGQVITVACPSTDLLSLVDGVRAEVVTVDDDTELAVEPEAEHPEPVRVRKTWRRLKPDASGK